MMRAISTGALLLLCTGGVAWAASEGQPEGNKAQQLMAQHCTRCHGSEVYTRQDRRVTSWEGLQKQVRNCELMLGLKWFDDDVAAVADHLNKHYYQFATSAGETAAE